MNKKLIFIFVAILILCAVVLSACKDKPIDPTTVTVTYEINYSGGSNPQAQTVEKGATVYLPAVSRDNYDFEGWYTASTDGTLVGKAGDSYLANADITLYAHWIEKQPESTTVTVKFAVNYNGGVNPEPKTVEKGTTIQLPDVSRDDYEFTGWYNSSTKGDFVGDAGDDYVANADITLYAYWQKEQSKTIVFYSTANRNLEEIVDLAIADFEYKYPDWTIVHEIYNYDDLYSKVKNNLQYNEQPDIAYCYPDHVASYLTTGKVVDLTAFVDSTAIVNGELVGYTMLELADFVSILYNGGIASNTYGNYQLYGYNDNSLLTLPMAHSTDVMYYNKTALNELGLTPATTWDELWLQCATIKQTYPSSVPIGFDSESNLFITMCEQNGWGYTSATGNHYLFNNAQTTQWLTQLKEKHSLKYFTTQQISGGYMSGLLNLGVENGGAMYVIGSSGGATNYRSNSFDIGVAPIPASVGGNNYSVSQGPSLVMFSNDSYGNSTEREIMTFMFMKELLHPAIQAQYAIASGYAPVRSSVYELAGFREYLSDTNVVSQTMKLVMALSNNLFTSPAFDGSAIARMQVGEALKYAVTGDKPVSTALNDAYNYCMAGGHNGI